MHETKDYIVLAPSAAWELKRWPIEYWQELINRLPNENIVLLGGPEDHFIEDLVKNAKPRRARLLNLAGKLSFAQSCSVIENAKHIVGGDSGLTHVGDSFAVPSSLIIGAAAFAYPARKSTKLEQACAMEVMISTIITILDYHSDVDSCKESSYYYY